MNLMFNSSGKNFDLQKRVIDRQGHATLFLSFSRGKDSLACFLECLESGLWTSNKFFYYYMCPGLSFVEEYLNYFSTKYGVEIIQYPSEMFLNLLESGCLQTPIGAAVNDEMNRKGKGFTSYTRKKLTKMAQQDFGLNENTYMASGVKASDSPMRRTALQKGQGITEREHKWYPIWNYSNLEVMDIMKRHDLKLPKDYAYWGLTMDGFDYRFIKYIKENLPEDWGRILEYFPRLDLMYYKHKHYFGDVIKKARFTPLIKKYNLQIL